MTQAFSHDDLSTLGAVSYLLETNDALPPDWVKRLLSLGWVRAVSDGARYELTEDGLARLLLLRP